MWSNKGVRVLALARFGCPVRQESTHAGAAASRIGIIGAPFEKGQRQSGVEDGPMVLRKTRFITRLTELGHDVIDYGDIREDGEASSQIISGPDGERSFQRVLRYSERLAEAVAGIKRDDRLCLTLGGDHSIAIGTIAGHSAALPPEHQVSVLWVDAHADMNTGRTSGSGNMHGMSVGYLLRAMQANRLQNGFPKTCLGNADVAFIGLRDMDKAEAEAIASLGLKAFSTRDIDQLGMAEVVARCLDHLQPSSTRPLHLSFDIDALDPTVAPGTGTPVSGGLTVREGCMVVEAAAATGQMKAMDLVEVNPLLADSKGATLTATSAKTILMAALAGHRGT